MPELASRLGMSVQAVSNLERNDELGVAKPNTVQRALKVLGLVRVESTVPLATVERAEHEARRIVERTTWNMALEGQKPDDASIERIVKTVTLELLKDG